MDNGNGRQDEEGAQQRSHRQHLTLSERRQEGDDRHLPKAGLVVGLAGVSRKTTLQCHRARGI